MNAPYVPSIVSEHETAPMMTLRHLSRLAVRWLVVNDKLTNDHMNLVWPNVLSMLARSMAVSRMQATEPGESELHDVMAKKHDALLAGARRREAGALDAETAARLKGHADRQQLENDRERIVFLSRFYPIPQRGAWNPAFWSPGQLAELGERLAAAVASEPVVEPSWYPDGWRESVKALGGANA